MMNFVLVAVVTNGKPNEQPPSHHQFGCDFNHPQMVGFSQPGFTTSQPGPKGLCPPGTRNHGTEADKVWGERLKAGAVADFTMLKWCP